MTEPDADPLRAAIAADCPHRLPDYDRHLAAIGQPTVAFLRLWQTEHAISRQPAVEPQLHNLEQQAAAGAEDGRRLLAEYSRIRHEIRTALDTI